MCDQEWAQDPSAIAGGPEFRPGSSASDVSLSGKGEAAGMAENKTNPTEVRVTTFIDAITDEKEDADAKALVKLMQGASGILYDSTKAMLARCR
jgi:hypothetical protein